MQYKEAKQIAIRVLRELEPFCKYAEIVGSVRREKPEVHDIELCVTPRTVEVTDLFGEVQEVKRIHEFCVIVKSLGFIIKGDVEKGRYVQIELPEKINLDLFIPVESDVYRQVAIRTGSSDYSHKVIAAGWLKKGWCGTKDGLRLQSECYQKVISTDNWGKEKKEWICNHPNPILPPVWESEYDFFKFINLTWIEPKNRNI